MSRRADPQRIYVARRDAHIARLTDHGVTPERADELVRAWEAEATAEGRDTASAAFWTGAADWIAERRSRR